jgi:magnesium-transporting ATPase (P-type)
MTGINYPRVLLGGLAAGVVANICDSVINALLMAEDMRRMAQRLGLDSAAVNGTGAIVTWIIIDFIYALLIVWTYAAIRPRLGPGPKTAVTAGLVIFSAVTVVLFGFQQMGIFTPDAFIKNTFFSLVTVVLVSLTGGAVYKED